VIIFSDQQRSSDFRELSRLSGTLVAILESGFVAARRSASHLNWIAWFAVWVITLNALCTSAAAQKPYLACECHPDVSPKAEFRYESKNAPIPKVKAEESTVGDILDWAPQYFPGFPSDTPRQDRELRLYHVNRAFLQAVWVNRYDCDFHLEVSQDKDKDAPRIIVEMTKDYCSERKELTNQLATKGVAVDDTLQELKEPLPVEIMGLAFQDKSEPRGTGHVDSLWELHPAIVKLIPPPPSSSPD